VDLTLVLGGVAVVAVLGALVRWRQGVLAFAARSVSYALDVRAEVKKVTWPGWIELRKSTGVIIVVVIIIGIVIGIMDWIFSLLLIDLLGRVLR
jgi:preprotein translocase subunit SecE